MLASYGYDGGDAVASYGYGGQEGGGPPPPPPVVQGARVQRTVMGGGGAYDVDMPVDYIGRIIEEEPAVLELQPVIDGDRIDFRPATKKKGIIDLDPLFLQDLIRQGRELDARITRKLRRLDEREREMVEMEKRIMAELGAERRALMEQSALSMKDKEEALKAGSLFRGGVAVPLGKVRPADAVLVEEPVRFSLFDDVVVPVGIGFGIGAGVTAAGLLVLKAWEGLAGKKKKRPGADNDGKDDSDGLVVPDKDGEG